MGSGGIGLSNLSQLLWAGFPSRFRRLELLEFSLKLVLDYQQHTRYKQHVQTVPLRCANGLLN